jgi:glycosyltransferase involved in cell wall biosynthesis
MNKIILLISLSGSYIGGAQKRYLSLFNFICDKRKDYYLVINKKLFITLKKNNVLKSCENVRVITLRGEKISDEKTGPVKTITEQSKENDQKKPSKLRLFLGRNKTFLKSFANWTTFIFEFRKILKELNCKVVYSVWTGGIFAWPLKKIYNFKLIHSYNDSSVADIERNYWKWFDSEYLVLKYCDKIDFLSFGILGSLEKEIGKIPGSRVSITPNSFINYDNYFPVYPKNNSVIFISRLEIFKNPILFLEAVKILNEKSQDNSEINYFIFGEGTLREEVKAFIKDNKLSNVHYEGLIHNTWECLRSSKVFISIQINENYPSQSLIEAMACENAIIASDIGETRLLVTENEGILVDFNPHSIADAIYRLFSTEGLIEKMGSNARKKVIENHTIEKFADYFYFLTEA